MRFYSPVALCLVLAATAGCASRPLTPANLNAATEGRETSSTAIHAVADLPRDFNSSNSARHLLMVLSPT